MKIEIKRDYNLNNIQKKIAKKLVYENYLKRFDLIILEAICGSGKTDMIIEVIVFNILKDKKICVCVPRKDIVHQIYNYLSKTIIGAKISILTGDFKKETVNFNIVVCTTHQLKKFRNIFDLVIIDEVDAFPYKNNIELYNYYISSLKDDGQTIYMTATLHDFKKKELRDYKNILKLKNHLRFHKRKHPKFKIYYTDIKGYNMLEKIKSRLIENNSKILVFMPSIKEVERLEKTSQKLFLNYIVKSISSKDLDVKEKIQEFRNGDIDILYSTTILERGFNFENIDVYIFLPEFKIYSISTIIQMCGRVDRHIKEYDNEIIFFMNSFSKKIITVKKIINKYNENK